MSSLLSRPPAWVLATLLICAGAGGVAAQSTDAHVAGVVVDTTDAAIGGAVVVLEHAGSTQTATTGEDGRFTFTGVAPGTYRLTVAHPGFAITVQDVSVAAGEPPLVEVRLAPQALAETLRVVAEAPSYAAFTSATGSKIAVPALDNPQSVSVVTRQNLVDRQVLRLSEAAQAVSGVVSAPGYGGIGDAGFLIRGFRGTFSGGNTLRNGFREFAFLTPRDLQGIERVEFLKGPGSLLYGLAEVGGFTNTITKRPRPAFWAEVGFQTGSFGLVRPTVDVTGPVGNRERLSYRANVAYDRNDSHRDFHQNESVYLSGSLSWRRSDRTTLQVDAERQRTDFVHDGGFGVAPEFLQLPVSRFLGEPDFNDGRNTNTSATIELSHALTDRWSYRGAVNAMASRSDLQFISYRGLQENRRLLNRVATMSDERTRNVSVQNELYGTVRTGRFRHTLVAGVDAAMWGIRYLWDQADLAPIDIHAPQYGARPGRFTASIFNEDAHTRYVGLFVLDQIAVSDRLTVSAGLRGDLTRLVVTDPRTGTELSRTDPSNVLPRAAVIYRLQPQTSIHGSYSASFLPQAGRDQAGRRFDPQQGRQVEFGVKQTAFGGRALATAAWFQIWKQHVLTADPTNELFQVQTGEQQSRGLELEISGEMVGGVSLNASYAYTDAFVSRDAFTPAGTTLRNVPRHAGGVLGNYTLSSGRLAGLSIGASAHLVGQRRVSLFTPLRLEAYTRADVFATYRLSAWRVQINVKNVADARYFESSPFSLYPQAGRQVVLALFRQFR